MPRSAHLSTWPDLIRLGWPVSATLLVRITMRTVDILVVGIVVGAPGVAALGIGDAAARIVLMTALGLGAGTIATVSQRIGADRHHAADVATTQTALLAVAVGLPLGLIGFVGAEAFFDLLGADELVTQLGVPYLRIVIATAVPRCLAIMLTRALQGAGDTRTPMIIRIIGTAVNITLTVLLVTGVGGLPEYGVVGAAIGTAVGNVLSAGLLIGVLARGRRAIGFTRAGLWAPDTARRIVSIGWPQVLERNLYAVGAIPLNAIVLTFGTVANAGFQVGRRVMLYGMLPSRGIATAASTYMGTSVGGADPDTGDRYGRGGLSLAVVISAAVAIPMLIWARPIASIFVHQPEEIGVAATWVRVYSVVTIVRAVYGVLRGAMQGAGDTSSPLIAGVIGVVGFAIVFSWLVGIVLGVGLLGVYVGILLDPLVRTALLGYWYQQGRWRRALARSDPELTSV